MPSLQINIGNGCRRKQSYKIMIAMWIASYKKKVHIQASTSPLCLCACVCVCNLFLNLYWYNYHFIFQEEENQTVFPSQSFFAAALRRCKFVVVLT